MDTQQRIDRLEKALEALRKSDSVDEIRTIVELLAEIVLADLRLQYDAVSESVV